MCPRWLCWVSLLLNACADPAPGVDISGLYLGDVLLANNDPSLSIFTSAELILEGGDVEGSHVTTKAPSSVVGEVGVLSGQITLTSDFEADAALTFAFPTLGTFTGRGVIIVSEATRGLAGTVPARDAAGGVIGQVTIAIQQE